MRIEQALATIKAVRETAGAITSDYITITYADGEGNPQEMRLAVRDCLWALNIMEMLLTGFGQAVDYVNATPGAFDIPASLLYHQQTAIAPPATGGDQGTTTPGAGA